MTLPLISSYAVLCAVQGVAVLVAWPHRLWHVKVKPVFGLLGPVAALVVGVVVIRGVDSGAAFFAHGAWLAALCGAAAALFGLRWRAWWVGPPVAVGAFLLAWLGSGRTADAAGLLLIVGACAFVAAVLRAAAPARVLAVGLLVLVAIDAILVLGLDVVRPASEALHDAVPPSASIPGGQSRPLPALQDATYGTALMGWLDVLAPAILGLLFTGQARWRFVGAVATAVAALAWGLLLNLRSEIPATIPVVAGLAVWFFTERKAH